MTSFFERRFIWDKTGGLLAERFYAIYTHY